MNFRKNTKTQFSTEQINKSSRSINNKIGMSRNYKTVLIVELLLIFTSIGLITYLEVNKPSQKLRLFRCRN